LITAEVALYPLKTTDASGVINKSIDTLKDSHIQYNVNSMNTHITGSREEIFKGLESMFSQAENNGGEITMVITLTNAAG